MSYFVQFLVILHTEMELMQFSAVVLLTLLTLKLLLLPKKVGVNPAVGNARWLMTAGIILLDIQFLLQYSLGLRAMGVTQAVLVNLLLFIPCSWSISLSVLYLQRRGNVATLEKWLGGAVWMTALLLLGIAAYIDGQPLFSDTPELHWAEVVSSVLYLLLQGHYSWRHLKNLRSMRIALQNYYDRDMDGMLLWMRLSILVLMVLAIMVPLLIFVESKGLAVFGILFFVGIFYLVDSFSNYVVSSAPKRMQEAEDSEMNIEEDSKEKDSEKEEEIDIQLSNSTDYLISKWIEDGGFLQLGMKLPNAAEAIGIPKYLLSTWLKQQGHTYANWITSLRIEEAKRTLCEHPDWTNEAVALHCGFNDRSYFQTVFKRETGMTPNDFQETLNQQ
jgi:AraC-like DNA-binding protein